MESVKLFGTVLEKLKEEKKESDPTLPAQRISHNLAEINHEMHELIDEVEITDERMANVTKTPLEDPEFLEEAYKYELLKGAIQSYCDADRQAY